VSDCVAPIAALIPRRRCRIAGTVNSVQTYTRPWVRTDVAVGDGTGTVLLRFTGRDGVPGFRPGRRVTVEGTPRLAEADVESATIMLNPLYTFEAGEPSG